MQMVSVVHWKRGSVELRMASFTCLSRGCSNMSDVPGCSTTHETFLAKAQSNRTAILLTMMFPASTALHRGSIPNGKAMDLLVVDLHIHTHDEHTVAQWLPPYRRNSRISSIAQRSPAADMKFSKVVSSVMSNPVQMRPRRRRASRICPHPLKNSMKSREWSSDADLFWSTQRILNSAMGTPIESIDFNSLGCNPYE